MNLLTKISSLLFLVAIVLVLLFLSISLDNEEPKNINKIMLSGNIHLTSELYITYAQLSDTNSLNLSLSVNTSHCISEP